MSTLDLDEKKDLAALIAEILIAAGYGAKPWNKNPSRIYVTRTLSKREQAIGYVEILPEGARNFKGIDRATATIRDLVEGDPRVEAFVVAVQQRGADRA